MFYWIIEIKTGLFKKRRYVFQDTYENWIKFHTLYNYSLSKLLQKQQKFKMSAYYGDLKTNILLNRIENF